MEWEESLSDFFFFFCLILILNFFLCFFFVFVITFYLKSKTNVWISIVTKNLNFIRINLHKYRRRLDQEWFNGFDSWLKIIWISVFFFCFFCFFVFLITKNISIFDIILYYYYFYNCKIITWIQTIQYNPNKLLQDSSFHLKEFPLF